MQGEPVPATVRFSNGAGNPDAPDYAPDVRGLAVKFYLPDGSRTDIVAQTAPRFPVRTPDAFIELLRAQDAGRRGLAAARASWPATREAIGALPANLPALRPPASYAACRYYAIHAFRLLDADGGSRYVRYTFVPEARERAPWRPAGPRPGPRLPPGGDPRAAGAAARSASRSSSRSPSPGDPSTIPSVAWPHDARAGRRVGTLELTGLDTERETGDDVLVFDPTRVTDGIELSDDPVLRFRPAAYSDSVRERTAADGPATGRPPTSPTRRGRTAVVTGANSGLGPSPPASSPAPART